LSSKNSTSVDLVTATDDPNKIHFTGGVKLQKSNRKGTGKQILTLNELTVTFWVP